MYTTHHFLLILHKWDVVVIIPGDDNKLEIKYVLSIDGVVCFECKNLFDYRVLKCDF